MISKCFVLTAVAVATIGAFAPVSSADPGDGSSNSSGPAAVTAQAKRVSPPAATPTVAPPTDGIGSNCPATGHAAVIDRTNQRAWLCTDGLADTKFPITTAITQPNPATYTVYGKSLVTTSTFGGHFSYLDNFVAFTRGKSTGARIGFHAVPRTASGSPYQPYTTVGTPAWFGQSSGCIRVLPDQSRLIWQHLRVGDKVVVIS